MAKTDSTIQVRVDEKTKRDAARTLQEMGLDMSSAVKLFLKNVVVTQSIPFEPRTKSGFTALQARQILKETGDALKNGKRYKNYREMADDL